jgi:hypothetical protein
MRPYNNESETMPQHFPVYFTNITGRPLTLHLDADGLIRVNHLTLADRAGMQSRRMQDLLLRFTQKFSEFYPAGAIVHADHITFVRPTPDVLGSFVGVSLPVGSKAARALCDFSRHVILAEHKLKADPLSYKGLLLLASLSSPDEEKSPHTKV